MLIFALLFLCVTPGEWDLPRPVFGSKNQCGAGTDYHARLRQGKTWHKKIKVLLKSCLSCRSRKVEASSLYERYLWYWDFNSFKYQQWAQPSHTLRINAHTCTVISTRKCPEPVIPVDWAKEELKACTIPGECFQVARLHSSAPKHTETLPVMQSAFLPVDCSMESWEVQAEINNQW